MIYILKDNNTTILGCFLDYELAKKKLKEFNLKHKKYGYRYAYLENYKLNKTNKYF